MNKNLSIIIVAIALLVGGYFYLSPGSAFDFSNKSSGDKSSSTKPKAPEGEIISRSGVHWHPELAIYIKGQKQIIPANVGIGMQYADYPQYDSMMMMTNMHTHDISGTIHWEVMQGPVKKDDVRLGQFFNVWGKKFTNSCIFDKCNGLEGRVKFKVNNKDNSDFENYFVKDKDKIEIIFE